MYYINFNHIFLSQIKSFTLYKKHIVLKNDSTWNLIHSQIAVTNEN